MTTNIKPENVNTSQPFWGAFDHVETEVSARYIVMYCQEKGEWTSFTYQEINDFYHSKCSNGGDYTFNRLINSQLVGNMFDESYEVGGGWITHPDFQGKHHLTREFIERCYRASPLITTC